MDMQTHDMLGALVIFEVLEWYFSRNCRVQCPPSGSKQDALHPELTLLQKTATHTQLQETRSHTCIFVFMCISIYICILVTRCASSCSDTSQENCIPHTASGNQITHLYFVSVFLCVQYLYFGNKMHVIQPTRTLFPKTATYTMLASVFQGTRSHILYFYFCVLVFVPVFWQQDACHPTQTLFPKSATHTQLVGVFSGN